MRPRQEITEMFSTFVELEGDRFSKWLIDIKLRRSIQNCLECSAFVPNSENFWALHWHKRWRSQSNRLARSHLSAYLQEPNYWAAKKTIAKFTNSQHSLADYFQMANAEIETILKNFNPEKCSSLKVYATIAIPSRLKDILRQRKEADICTNWALLRKVSKKQLLEALDKAGLSPSIIAQYRLAWTCFKELYVQNQPGGTKALPEPDRQLWEAIVNLYNRPILWVLPYWGDILWICGWSVVGSLIVWRVRSLSNKGCAIFAIVVILYGVCAIALLKQGLWIPFIPSAFAVVASDVVVILIQNRREFSTTPQSLGNSGKEVN